MAISISEVNEFVARHLDNDFLEGGFHFKWNGLPIFSQSLEICSRWTATSKSLLDPGAVYACKTQRELKEMALGHCSWLIRSSTNVKDKPEAVKALSFSGAPVTLPILVQDAGATLVESINHILEGVGV